MVRRFFRPFINRARRFCTDNAPVAQVGLFTTVGIPVGLGVARCFGVDLFVQRCDPNFKQFNYTKAIAFGIYGGITCAMIVPMQVFVYAKYIAANPAQKLRPLAAAIFDIAVVLPLTDLPVYYIISTIACNPQDSLKKDFSNAWQSYKDYVISDTQAAASIWVPINILNFFLVPAPYRGLVFAAGGYAWSSYFCYLKSSAKEPVAGNPHRPTADFENFEWAMALMGHDMFDMMDKDGSGGVSEEEFAAWLARSTRLITPSDRHTIFDMLDEDNDGVISSGEFDRYLKNLQLTKEGRSHILTHFEETDANGDGILTREELTQFFETVGVDVHVDVIMKQYDEDGNGSVSLAEVQKHFEQFYGLKGDS